MPQHGWSWLGALESGELTPTQLEALQAMVDEGEVESLTDAARLLDYQLAKRADPEQDL